jgi:O-antigen ligase
MIRFETISKKSVSDWYRITVLNKLDHPIGWGLMLLMALVLALAVALGGSSTAGLLLALTIGLPLIFASLRSIEFGVLFLISISFFLMGVKKMLPEIPFGVFLDVGILLLFLAMVFRQSMNKDWSFAANPISYWILIWIAYNLLQIVNPIAESQEAWFYTVRQMAGTIVFYFIILFAIRSLRYAKILLGTLLVLAFLAALYGLNQEMNGLTSWEYDWMMSDIQTYKLIYQHGRIRIWSFLSDPTTFGIMMAYTTVLCYTLLFGPWKPAIKVFLAICALLCLMGAFWSGTRTAYIVIPAGLFFTFLMAIIKKNKALIGVSLIFFGLGAVGSQLSTSNNTLYRVQTAFKPSQDRSYQVRLKTQARIKSVIQTHPIGGGLGSCGAWGKRFAPHTIFADIEPDSGYVRIAVETGWVGFILYLGLLIAVMRECVRHFIRSRDPVIVNMYMGLGGLLFALIVANYGQEAIILLPNSVVFYAVLALVVRLKDFDPNYVKTS